MIVKSLDGIFQEIQKEEYKFVLPVSTNFWGNILTKNRYLEKYCGVSIKKVLNEEIFVSYGEFSIDGEGREISSLVGISKEDLSLEELSEFNYRLGTVGVTFLTNLVRELGQDVKIINSCNFFEKDELEYDSFINYFSRMIFKFTDFFSLGERSKKEKVRHDYFFVKSLAWKILELSSNESLNFLEKMGNKELYPNLRKFYSEVKRISSQSGDRFFRFIEYQDKQERAMFSGKGFLPKDFDKIASYLLNPNALGKEF